MEKEKEKLKEHLAASKVNHDANILAEPSLKYAHIYCVIHNISGQQYGPLLEKYIILKHEYTKNAAKNCIGDCCKLGKNYEVKASLGGAKHIKFNFVQIRLSHDIAAYILTAYYLTLDNVEEEGELFIFNVPKEMIGTIIFAHGSYAHGTKMEHGAMTMEEVLDVNNKREYALRPSYGDKCWVKLLEFRVNECDL